MKVRFNGRKCQAFIDGEWKDEGKTYVKECIRKQLGPHYNENYALTVISALRNGSVMLKNGTTIEREWNYY